MKPENIQLSNYIDLLQAKGKYTFLREEALEYLNCSDDAFRFAALRLMKKNRLIRPTRRFYVIVPTEYSPTGSPPITWFIDSLMKFYNQPYYVGLLSAAALHGAAHQQPQVFQVVTNTPIRNIKIGNYPIKFFIEKHISSEDYQSVKTPTGYMQVSIPEITAIDLLRHVKAAGHLNHIATVLIELQEQLDNQRLKKILETNKIEIPIAQRLGYLLEKVGANPDIIQSLKQWLQLKKVYFVPLRSDKPYQSEQKNKDWYLYINEIIEADL